MAEDGRHVTDGSTSFYLTPRQSYVVIAMAELRAEGFAEAHYTLILARAGVPLERLADAFRGSPAWKTIVLPGSRRGLYQLPREFHQLAHDGNRAVDRINA